MKCSFHFASSIRLQTEGNALGDNPYFKSPLSFSGENKKL